MYVQVHLYFIRNNKHFLKACQMSKQLWNFESLEKHLCGILRNHKKQELFVEYLEKLSYS